MQVLVNCDDPVCGDEELIRRVEGVIAGTLERFGDRVFRVEVRLSDLNSEKPGDRDKVCSLEARMAGAAPVTARHESSHFGRGDPRCGRGARAAGRSGAAAARPGARRHPGETFGPVTLKKRSPSGPYPANYAPTCIDTPGPRNQNTRLVFAEGYPSGQREQTVNLPAYAFVGSNPTPSTTSAGVATRTAFVG